MGVEGPSQTSDSSAMREEIEKLRQMVKGMHKKLGEPVPKRGVPFAGKILEDELPASFRPLAYEYGGTTNPAEHLSRFENSALLHRYSDGVKCRVFLTTLTKSAQQWFDQLPADSIHSFEDFSSMFLHQFASSRKRHKTPLTLFSLKQREGESLRNYIRRFNAASLEVPTTSSKVLMNALAQGLLDGEFFRSLAKKPVQNFGELLDRAEKYVNAEEAQRCKKEDFEKRRERRDHPRMELPLKRTHDEKRLLSGRSVEVLEHYTPLNATRAQILATIMEMKELRWPRTYSNIPTNPQSDKFCSYHNNYGHRTEECCHLKAELERLVQAGYLREWVALTEGHPMRGSVVHPILPPMRTPKRWRRKEKQQLEPPMINPPMENSKKGYIHMIVGGTTDGDTNRARKAQVRIAKRKLDVMISSGNLTELSGPAIQFNPEEAKYLVTSHNDALVITVEIAGFDVARIFVDTGSSADILFYEAYQAMKLDTELHQCNTDLFGFGGGMVEPMGQIVLPVAQESYPYKKTHLVKFLVVDAPSTYNVILGRPMLNMFQAVVSTFHIKLKFPVDNSVGEVIGDQYTSKKCYVDAVKRVARTTTTDYRRDDKKERRVEERECIDDRLEKAMHVKPHEDLQLVELIPGQARK